MHEDGWWWSTPVLTNRSIKRAILREMLAHRLLSRSDAQRRGV
jgi:glutamate-1-semialdehyde 2,1-aminomutase